MDASAAADDVDVDVDVGDASSDAHPQSTRTTTAASHPARRDLIPRRRRIGAQRGGVTVGGCGASSTVRCPPAEPIGWFGSPPSGTWSTGPISDVGPSTTPTPTPTAARWSRRGDVAAPMDSEAGGSAADRPCPWNPLNRLMPLRRHRRLTTGSTRRVPGRCRRAAARGPTARESARSFSSSAPIAARCVDSRGTSGRPSIVDRGAGVAPFVRPTAMGRAREVDRRWPRLERGGRRNVGPQPQFLRVGPPILTGARARPMDR